MHLDLGLSLWQALKLRLAGKEYAGIATRIGESIEAYVEKAVQPVPTDSSADGWSEK